ncbi:MAG TPA: DUF1223 domain-containing protein [Burkholderiales bacterium]|nr:DUF1223 domain-containing protein [Burkholderiales bacterium]
MRIAGVLLGLLLVLPVQAAPCVSESGPGTAALVELYTSEGCSSCPPAERWLGTLAERYPGTAVVPLALHVDYWDYIGWKDSYAKREFALRQRKLSQLQRMALVYTPQVMLQGRDFRRWGTEAFDEAVKQINAQPARARLKLTLLNVDERGLAVEVRAELAQPVADAALYLASYQSKLESKVMAGENRGRILTHDHVVLEWLGPFEVEGRRVERRTLPLLPGATGANSGAAAFVQNRRTGEVLQALLRSAC